MSLQITQNRFKQAEFVRVVFAVTPEHGAKPEDLLVPDYWMHVARDLKPGAVIEACPESREWFAQFFVLACGPNWAKLALLFKVDFEAGAADPEAGEAKHKIEYKGSIKQWCVIRLSDSQVIKDELPTKEEARKVLQNYEKVLLA